MNNIPSQTINEYDNASGTNPSLITAGFPSGSIMTSRLNQSSPNDHFNQNQANHTIVSHRTVSDTYLNLSRKDINDLMAALHTLAQYMQNNIDNKISVDDTTFYSNNTNHTLKNSTSRYSIRSRRHSLSSCCCLNNHHRHIKHHLNIVKEFQHDLNGMNRRKEHRILQQLQNQQKYLNHSNLSNYPSYSSNAILYTSPYKSNTQSKKIYSQAYQSPTKISSQDQYQQSIKNKLSSSISLSSYILDQLIYINQKEPISTLQILPQQAYTLQIVQNNSLHTFMSIDSLNTKNKFITPIIQKLNNNQISGMGDQLNLNKIDTATQWSLQVSTPQCIKMDTIKSASFSKCQNKENSTILTELSPSITTIASNNSIINQPLISINNPYDIKSDLSKSIKHNLTKSETEQFLTTLNISPCKCSTAVTHLCHDNNSLSSSNKNKIKPISIKVSSKRSRPHTSKSSKTNQVIKRSRPSCRSQSNNRSMTIISKEDSSFDFFDMDTTFSDAYERLFN